MPTPTPTPTPTPFQVSIFTFEKPDQRNHHHHHHHHHHYHPLLLPLSLPLTPSPSVSPCDVSSLVGCSAHVPQHRDVTSSVANPVLCCLLLPLTSLFTWIGRNGRKTILNLHFFLLLFPSSLFPLFLPLFFLSSVMFFSCFKYM